MARLLVLLLIFLNFFSPHAGAEVSNEPFYYHEVIGAIYHHHHDNSFVLYAYDPLASPPMRTALNGLVDQVVRYVPRLKDGISGHPEPTGSLLLFTHNHEKLFFVGDTWLSDGQQTVIIDQKTYAAITDLRRKNTSRSGGLGWKKRWQEEIADRLERERQLNEWEQQNTGTNTEEKVSDFSRQDDMAITGSEFTIPDKFVKTEAVEPLQNFSPHTRRQPIENSTDNTHNPATENSTTKAFSDSHFNTSLIHSDAHLVGKNGDIAPTVSADKKAQIPIRDKKPSSSYLLGFILLLVCCALGFILTRTSA